MKRTSTASSQLSGSSNRSSDAAPVPRKPMLSRAISVQAIMDDATSAKVSKLHGISLEHLKAKLVDSADPLKLTPLRRHYLKKQLCSLQVQHEVSLLSMPDALAYFGSPFRPVSEAARQEGTVDVPILRFLFHYFFLTFPFLAKAPASFWPDKVQVFYENLMARNIGQSEDPEDLDIKPADDEIENESRSKSTAAKEKLEKYCGLLLSSGIKLKEMEEVLKIDQCDLSRIQQERLERSKNKELKATVEVNVVTVRLVSERGRIRSKNHEEFIIRTRQVTKSGEVLKETFVSRRYGDFKALSEQLKLVFPEEELRSLPAKDKSASLGLQPSAGLSDSSNNSNSEQASIRDPSEINEDSTYKGWSLFGFGSSGSRSRQESVDQMMSSPLAREKNRLTLRSYLRDMMTHADVADSDIIMNFLNENETVLSESEIADQQRREGMDNAREEGNNRFKEEMERRAEDVMGSVSQFKADILKRDGLTRAFATIREHPDMKTLPIEYRKVMEWARISLASVIYNLFVSDDRASETLNVFKKVHGMMPYFALKAALTISNPLAMPSILQSIIGSSFSDQAKELAQGIDQVKTRIGDDVISEKIRQFVYASKEFQDAVKADASVNKQSLLSLVLRSSDDPKLEKSQMQRVAAASRTHKAYLAANRELKHYNEEEVDSIALQENMLLLLRLYVKLRDKEQVLALIFEGVTSELLKDIITIFYTPLAAVYKAANIADSVGDLSTFITDLIKTVESVADYSHTNPAKTVETFIALVDRHEATFYKFVYRVHTKGADLFGQLMGWIELFLNFAREGLGPQFDIEQVMPASETERRNVLKEIDAIATYHYKLKVAHELKTRSKFLLKSEKTLNEEGQAWVDGVVSNFPSGDVLSGDVNDLANEESRDESDFEYDADKPDVGSNSRRKKRNVIKPPLLEGIPALVPKWVDMLRPHLE